MTAVKKCMAAAAIALGLVACAHRPELAIDPAAPGSLSIVVDGSATSDSLSVESWLRDSTGSTKFGSLAVGRERSYDGLAAGEYDVCAKLGLERRECWIYVERHFVVRPGATTEVRLEVPAQRTARLALRVEEKTPPFYLLLAEPGTAFPSELLELQQRLAQTVYPDGLVAALQSDGNESLVELPSLPAGSYLLFQMANDWQLGDRMPQGRTLAIELRAGATTTVWLEDELARMRAE